MEATQVNTINCKFCQGERPTNGKRCLGCGEEIARAKARPPKKTLACPKCLAGSATEIEPNRFTCRACGSVFEDAEFSFLDTRPHEAIEKKERIEAATRRRRRAR